MPIGHALVEAAALIALLGAASAPAGAAGRITETNATAGDARRTAGQMLPRAIVVATRAAPAAEAAATTNSSHAGAGGSAAPGAIDPNLVGGPFRVEVPGQSSAPAPAPPAGLRTTAPADAPAAKAASPNKDLFAADRGPTRTIFEQGDTASAAPARQPSSGAMRATASEPASAAAASASANSSCVAGCYTPTSTRAVDTSARQRQIRDDKPRMNTKTEAPASTGSSQIECVAGCADGRVR
jgi:hypothetical protein